MTAFSRFEKCFTRLEGGEVLGWNRQFFRALTGPGYFQARISDGAPPWGPGLIFDYRLYPERRPDGWPRPRSNRGFPSRLVFGGLVDYVRHVTEGVLIGRATRGDRPMNTWFSLVRPGQPCN